MTSSVERREVVEHQTRFVEPAVFVERLTSRERLTRDDDLAQSAYGLLDPVTGRRILVPVDKLLRYAARKLDAAHGPTADSAG